MNPLKKASRAAKLLVTSVRVIKDPNSLDQVIELADRLRTPEIMQPLVESLTRDPDVAKAFHARERMGKLDLAELAALPPGTLGREFAAAMRAQNLDPKDLPSRPARDDHEFISAHLYETHDVWHVVTGFDTDVAGELGLQAFYIAQSPFVLGILILALGLLNTILYAREDYVRRMSEITRGWTLGRQAKPLFGVAWAKMWERPLVEIRRDLLLAV